jgi:hypothetical protein
LKEVYLKYSLGFLIASLVQAGIVALTEFFNISSLNVDINALQLLIHIIAGQIAGYVLLFALRKLEFLRNINQMLIGVIWGIIVWAIIIPINAAQGKITGPWSMDIATLLSSVTAFALYGIISSYTIKIVDFKKIT